MQGEFEMSFMGELTLFIGLQIKQDKEGTFVSQTKYTLELLKKFDMQYCKSISTPISSTLSIDKDEFCTDVDNKRDRGMIGSLLYLTTSRPDIMFSICMCARYQVSPKESHLKTIKQILCYLSGTIHFGLWYQKEVSCCLVGFSDFDFAVCKPDRKSTSGTCHLFGYCLISRGIAKRNIVFVFLPLRLNMLQSGFVTHKFYGLRNNCSTMI